MTKSFNLRDTLGNPLRTKPPEGQMMAIMRGSKDGPLDKIVASIPGWHFKGQERGFKGDDSEKWELVQDVNPETGVRVHTAPAGSMPEVEFGVIGVGFFRALRIQHTRRSQWRLKADRTGYELVQEEVESPYFPFHNSRGILVSEVKSVGNVKADIRLNVAVRLVNPYKALFLVNDWESLLEAAISGAVREHIGGLSIEQIRRDKGALAKRIKKLKDKADGLKEKFGIEVVEVWFIGFSAAAGDSKVLDALEAQEVNRLMADAAIQKAREIEILAEAETAVAAHLTEAYRSGGAAALVRAAGLISDALKTTK